MRYELRHAQLPVAVRVDERERNRRVLLVDAEAFEEQLELLDGNLTVAILIDGLRENHTSLSNVTLPPGLVHLKQIRQEIVHFLLQRFVVHDVVHVLEVLLDGD